MEQFSFFGGNEKEAAAPAAEVEKVPLSEYAFLYTATAKGHNSGIHME